MKTLIKKVPLIENLARKIYPKINGYGKSFPGSKRYWEDRYTTGGNSGAGSYGKFAEFKAEVINAFVTERGIQSVTEFGCGDGNQLMLARYPNYLGFDVSEIAISKCRQRFANDKNKSFRLIDRYDNNKADLTLSLDVIYHLVEDTVFESYMRTLFNASNRFVIIYSSDSDSNKDNEASHVRHRKFTRWIQENRPDWKLLRHIPNRYPFRGDYRVGSFADFYIYEKS